jgi:hypothetical protein
LSEKIILSHVTLIHLDIYKTVNLYFDLLCKHYVFLLIHLISSFDPIIKIAHLNSTHQSTNNLMALEATTKIRSMRSTPFCEPTGAPTKAAKNIPMLLVPLVVYMQVIDRSRGNV